MEKDLNLLCKTSIRFQWDLGGVGERCATRTQGGTLATLAGGVYDSIQICASNEQKRNASALCCIFVLARQEDDRLLPRQSHSSSITCCQYVHQPTPALQGECSIKESAGAHIERLRENIMRDLSQRRKLEHRELTAVQTLLFVIFPVQSINAAKYSVKMYFYIQLLEPGGETVIGWINQFLSHIADQSELVSVGFLFIKHRAFCCQPAS